MWKHKYLLASEELLKRSNIRSLSKNNNPSLIKQRFQSTECCNTYTRSMTWLRPFDSRNPRLFRPPWNRGIAISRPTRTPGRRRRPSNTGSGGRGVDSTPGYPSSSRGQPHWLPSWPGETGSPGIRTELSPPWRDWWNWKMPKEQVSIHRWPAWCCGRELPSARKRRKCKRLKPEGG